MIDLPSSAVEMLRRHRAAQNEEKLLIGPGYDSQDLVFAKPDGGVWAPTSFDWHYRVTVKAAKIGKVRFHDLHHTHATQLLKQGINVKVVSERLGHASIRITLDTYGHMLPNMQREAASKFDDLVRGATKGL